MDIRVWIVVVLVTLSVGGGIYFKIRSEIRKDVLHQIEQQNNKAGDSSDSARDSFDLCPDVLWDFGTGKCKRP